MVYSRATAWPRLLAAAALTTLVGCDSRPTQPITPPPGSIPEPVLKTPEDAARSALICLQANLRAVAHADEQSAKASLEKLRTIAAATTIRQTFANNPLFNRVVGDDAIDGVVSNWAAAIAYYAGVSAPDNGFRFERMHRVSQTPTRVVLTVPACGSRDEALIQLTCVRDDQDLWHVAGIQFAAPPPGPLPATQPAEKPGSQPS